MIRLAQHREPTWLDIVPGVRLHVRPLTSGMMLAARSEAAAAQDGDRYHALISALARRAVEAWDGVVGESDAPAPATPENIDALFDLWPVAEAFERLYLGPALLLDAEKNGLRPGPSGTTAQGQSTAPRADD